MTNAKDFINNYEDPSKNVDHDPREKIKYDRNLPILKLIIGAVVLCAE